MPCPEAKSDPPIKIFTEGPAEELHSTASAAARARPKGQTQTVKSAIVALMAGEEAIRRKHDLLSAAMYDYFSQGPSSPSDGRKQCSGYPVLFSENWPADYRNFRTSPT